MRTDRHYIEKGAQEINSGREPHQRKTNDPNNLLLEELTKEFTGKEAHNKGEKQAIGQNIKNHKQGQPTGKIQQIIDNDMVQITIDRVMKRLVEAKIEALLPKQRGKRERKRFKRLKIGTRNSKGYGTNQDLCTKL